LNALFRDQNFFRFLLISTGIIGVFFIYYFSFLKRKKARKNIPGGITSPDSHNAGITNHEKPLIQSKAPSFTTLQKPFGIWGDLLRACLIALSLLVAAALTLILMPQRTIDAISHQIQLRHVSSVAERIALLYLGDEIEGGQFRLRGVVRNITTTPIEQMDATVRLYAQDGTMTETVLVRFDKEILAPDEIARLDLIIPNYKMDISGYAVEFKLREGARIPYKDMRMNRSP
jgi:hypothetical protein